MIKFLLPLLALILIGLAKGQLNQTCIHTRLVTPNHFFELDKVLGTWYPAEFYSGLTVDATPLNFKCLQVNFTQNGPRDLAESESYVTLDSGESITDSDPITVAEDISAIWEIRSDDGGDFFQTTDVVWLQTDYENWALTFECSVVENYRYEGLVIWSRERIINPKTLEVLRVLATGYGFPIENVRPVDQVSC